MSDEKTEQPTPKRLREAREKGDVCRSQDIAPALTTLAVGVYLAANAGNIFVLIRDMVSLPMAFMTLPFEEAMAKVAPLVIDSSLKLVAPVVGLVMGVAFLGTLAQTGVLFAVKAAMPKLENLDPKKWFQKVFSMKNLFELVKNLIKVGVLGAVVFFILRKYLPMLFSVPGSGIGAMWSVIGSAVNDLVLGTHVGGRDG